MKHYPNRWNYPVHIPPARRVTSGVRRVLPERPIPLERRIDRRATVSDNRAFYATLLLLALPCLALLLRAVTER